MPFFMTVNRIPVEEKRKKYKDTFRNVSVGATSPEILNNIVSDTEEKTKYVFDLKKSKAQAALKTEGGIRNTRM